MHKGVVYKSTGSWYTVKTDLGDFLKCRVKGKLRTHNLKSTNPVAVGDEVSYTKDCSGDQTVGTICEVWPRKNAIVRKSVNLSKQTHIIASNVDYAFVFVTLKNPVTPIVFIDRVIVANEAYGVRSVLLFSKVDTYGPETVEQMRSIKAVYESIGYTCIELSAVTGKNIEELRQFMQGKTSVFAGYSGVGKSSLINALDASLNLRVGENSIQHEQGAHITTFAEMFDLAFGARIIDTPGIRGFGFTQIDKKEIKAYFVDFYKYKPLCKFYDCMHLDEPDCAVKKAVESQQLSALRYKSYVQMLSEKEGLYRTDVYK